MVDLGYESHNEILNLGSLAIFLFVYFLKVILFILLLPISSYSPKAKAFKEKMKEGLFFSELISLLLEAYFEMLISTYLQFRAPLDSTNGEVTSVGLGYLCLFLIIIFLPVASVWILC